MAGSSRKSPTLQPATASVEQSLDDFIARAREKPVDLTPFDTEQREQSLRRELETLQSKLAAAESRAASTPRQRLRWGLMLVSFLVGAASMFGVSFMMNQDTPPPPVQPQTAAHATEPAREVPPPPAPAPPAPAPPAPEAAPPAPPAPVVAPPAPETVAAKPTPKRAIDKPKRPPRSSGSHAEKTSPAAPAPGSDTGLYNPF